MAEKQWPLEAAEVPDSYRPEVTEQQKREMRLLYAERSRRRIESLRLRDHTDSLRNFESTGDPEQLKVLFCGAVLLQRSARTVDQSNRDQMVKT